MLDPKNDHPPTAPTSTRVLNVAPHQPLIGPEKLKQLYTAMLKVRWLHERLHSRATGSARKLFFQEACEVGCTIDLRPHDTIAASADQYFVAVMRGLSPPSTEARLGQQPFPSPIENTLELNIVQNDISGERLIFATGIAFGNRVGKRDNVVIAFSEEEGFGTAGRSLRVAFDQRLPIVYVQQETGGTTSPVSRRRRNSNQLPVIPVEQSDVVAVYRVAYEAIDKARRGAGPTIIQCVRHLPPSNKSRGATRGTDPIESMEWHLRKKHLWSDEFKQSIEESLSDELKTISATRKQSGSGDPSSGVSF